MSYLEIRCKVCGSKYTLMTDELNVLAFFKCSECEQHSAYAAGNVFLLDQDIMEEGTDDEKFQHVLEVIRELAIQLAADVLGGFDRIIDVSSSIDMPAFKQYAEGEPRTTSKTAKEKYRAHLLPSITSKDASRISAQEVRDFIQIDLNLIDKRSYFDKIFGRSRKKKLNL